MNNPRFRGYIIFSVILMGLMFLFWAEAHNTKLKYKQLLEEQEQKSRELEFQLGVARDRLARTSATPR